jgi:hypothetical protein
MTKTLTLEDLAKLDQRLASQIGDDISVIFNHESLFRQSRDMLSLLSARVAELEADKTCLRELVGSLLTRLDEWDQDRADETRNGLTMHAYGQTPGWFVEAAFWSCYGFAPSDPRANFSAQIGAKE